MREMMRDYKALMVNLMQFGKDIQILVCQVLFLTRNRRVITRKKLFCGELNFFIGKLTKINYRYCKKTELLIIIEGDIKYFQLRQLYCEHCKRVHLECPDIIEPNKHYMSEVITDAISNEFSSCCAESTTIQRWKKELNSK